MWAKCPTGIAKQGETQVWHKNDKAFRHKIILVGFLLESPLVFLIKYLQVTDTLSTSVVRKYIIGVAF